MDLKKLFQRLNKSQQIRILQQWDKAYYELDDPIVSDELYDYCLAYYNSQNPEEKYTSSLGKASSDLPKFEHPYPVLSLAKITTRGGYEGWGHKFEYNVVVEPKIDGLTVVYYPDGKMVSRGNGHVGEILINANDIIGLPKPLDKPVRMEVCIDKDVYITIPGVNKNPRNLAAGILRRKTKTGDVKYLTYYAYNILGSDLSEENQLIALRQNGFKTVDYVKLESRSKYGDYFKKMSALATCCLAPTDGIVIKCNLPEIALNAGITAHHPNNMVAFKFVSKVEETTITNIEWSRGRNTYTPVAVFESVVLGGSTITKASLHNLNIMKQLNVKVGSKAQVTLKNEIIPQILSCEDTDKSVNVVTPQICMYCGSELEVNESQQLICPNNDCSYLMVSDIERFVSRNGLDITGISSALAAKIAKWQSEAPFATCSVSFVKMNPNLLSEALGITYYMASKLYNSIQTSLRNVDPAKFLCACNIPNIGPNAAKDILNYYDNNFYNFLANFKDTGKDINGVGEVAYESVLENIDKINRYLHTTEVKFKEVKAEPATKLVFAITGKLNNTRNELVKLIEDAGYTYSSTITKKVNYLVCGENAGSKIDKAKKYGITVITEDSLQEILKKEGSTQNG